MLDDRIEARIDKSGDCWIWMGGCGAGDSPFVRQGRRCLSVRKLVYEQVMGEAPDGNLRVRCRNSRCVNPAHRETFPDRFWFRVDQSAGPDACWPWTASRQTQGYGQIGLPKTGHTVRAHRVAYELAVGPIPDGHEIHHRCRTRACCNPSHMEPMTRQAHMALHAAGG